MIELYEEIPTKEYFHKKVDSKTAAEEKLKDKPIGSFLVRDSSMNPHQEKVNKTLKNEEEKPKGRYFAISYVSKEALIEHLLIYIPHSKDTPQAKIAASAEKVSDIDTYLMSKKQSLRHSVIDWEIDQQIKLDIKAISHIVFLFSEHRENNWTLHEQHISLGFIKGYTPVKLKVLHKQFAEDMGIKSEAFITIQDLKTPPMESEQVKGLQKRGMRPQDLEWQELIVDCNKLNQQINNDKISTFYDQIWRVRKENPSLLIDVDFQKIRANTCQDILTDIRRCIRDVKSIKPEADGPEVVCTNSFNV